MSLGPDVWVVGHVTDDLDGELRRPGGCALYAALTYRGLGFESAVYTSCCPDADALRLLDGPSLHVIPSENTTTFLNAAENGRRVQWLSARAAPVTPPNQEHMRRTAPRAVHVATVLDEVDLVAWSDALRNARQAGAVVALSAQGLFRAEDAPGTASALFGPRRVRARRWYASPDELAHIDAVFVSDEDLDADTEGLALLCAHVELVFLTHGERGATVFRDGTSLGHVGTYRANPADPTGAGDSFAAGTVVGLLEGCPPLDAARLGAAAASVCIESIGVRGVVEHPEAIRPRRRAVAVAHTETP